MKKMIARFLLSPRFIRLLGKLGIVNFASLIYGALKSENRVALFRNLKYFKTRFKHNNLPIPSSRMRFYVAGTFGIEWFLKLGRLGADTITDVLKDNNLDIDHFEAILDFGCGCGRVTRYWKDLKNVKVFGCDYNPTLLDWCSNNLKFGNFRVNQLDPPLSFDDNQFDFIYALSVFTHLPESTQHAWIEELSRILKPNGYLMITTHGESYLSRLTPNERKCFNNNGLVVSNEEVSGTNFCHTYHSYAFVKEKLASGFSIVSFIPEGAKGNPHQDLYLLSKR
jgi:SAM-dependent methyltransferase